MRLLTAILLLISATAGAQVIQSSNQVPWVPYSGVGQTVGVRGGIPVRNGAVLDVTQPPYNVDSTGHLDAAPGILSAIAVAAATNGVVFFPPGIYNITNQLSTGNFHNFTLRGSGSNSILFGAIVCGSGQSLGAPGRWVITNGATKGSTNINLNAMTRDPGGEFLAVGDMIQLSGYISSTNEIFQYQASAGDPNELRLLHQAVVVVSTNMSTNGVTFAPPLVWDMSAKQNGTNAGLGNLYNAAGIPAQQPVSGIGIENLTVTMTNWTTHEFCPRVAEITMSPAVDCWVTNCWLEWANNYQLELAGAAFSTVSQDWFQHSFQAGKSDSAGLLIGTGSGILVEDDIFTDGLSPALELNNQVGCAFFGLFITNCGVSIDNHQSHPMMNLYEEINGDSTEADGYFGSASHMTYFRDVINSGFLPVNLKRWTTYMQFAGNVLGSPSFAYSNYLADTNFNLGGGAFCIIAAGWPNIGNQGFIGTSPPQYWNWPQQYMFFGTYTNGFTLTADSTYTTNLHGNFSTITNANEANAGSGFNFMFQDAVNTNWYHSGVTNANGFPVSAPWDAGTGTGINILCFPGNGPVLVSNGWTAYLVGPSAYQQIQLTNITTDNIQGNWDASHNAVYWGTNTPQSLVSSYLYTNGPPAWWGAHRWPAIDPMASPMVLTIPAQDRYNGVGVPPVTTNTTAVPTSLLF